MKDKILCIIGRSGSGKTTIAEELEKRGFVAVQSYTTRKPRFEGERGHTFVSDEEFNKLKNILAYNEYNGARYCTTMFQIDNSDVYVVDIPGLKMLREKYHGLKRIVAVGLMVSEGVARDRMLSRGDSDEKVKSRISEDNTAFADLGNCCDFMIDSSYLSPSILADIIESTLRQFPSKTQTVCVGDLHIGDCIWLGEEFDIVNEDSKSRVAIAKNDIWMQFSDEASFSWKKSKVREYLNQKYMYKILDNILHSSHPYDMLLGLKMQNSWDKIGVLSPDEYKQYSKVVPEAFKDPSIICDLSAEEAYHATIFEGHPVISCVNNSETAVNKFNIKPVIILSNEAEVTLVEKNNAG